MTEPGVRDQASILVPLDGSPLAEQAIPCASALAGEDAQLLFVQVTLVPEAVRGTLGDVTASREEVAATYLEAGQRELRQAAERWQAVAPRVEIEVVAGDAAEEILRVCQERGCELIALATHGRGAFGRWTFGSVADRIARASTVPILLVRPRDAEAEIRRPDVRRLVVPYDGSELAAEAVPVARRLAIRLGVAIHLIQAISSSAITMPYSSMEAAYSAEIIAELDQQMEQEAQASLDEIAQPLASAGVKVSTAVVTGDAAGAIDEATTDGDLVVMTSHGRTGVRRWLLGSVAEKLVRDGSGPVVLVPASTRAKGE
ncbi:MAG: universal stress protein [Thermomicrobiales bacterium]